MQAELFCADLFEYQAILESEIATSVLVYATAAALLVNIGVAITLVCKSNIQPAAQWTRANIYYEY
jgi:hypothetical protein